MFKKIILFMATALLLVFAFGCGTEKAELLQFSDMTKGEEYAVMHIAHGDNEMGVIKIRFFPKQTPKTVENFVKLVKDGFYDGLVFHRVYEGFMAQGGGFDANDVKKPADSIKGEFKNNGYTQNTLKHTRGVISMARIGGKNDSASSEFFIMYDTATSLDGDYAAFGKVTEGMEVVDSFLKVDKITYMDMIPTKPVEPIIIKQMTVIE